MVNFYKSGDIDFKSQLCDWNALMIMTPVLQ